MSDQVQLIERVLDILEYLSESPKPKGPTEIGNAVGLSKSTVYRCLSSLQERGYVEKTEGEGTYRIGVTLVEVVSNHLNSLELQTEARPQLQALQHELGLVVHLGILDGHEVVYIEKLDIAPNLRSYTQIGLRVPGQCSSLGKCLLSSMSGDQLRYTMSACNFEQYTPNTITSFDEFKAHLREVRRQGWAMDNEEYILKHRCLAAPVYDYRGEVIAAVSASGPTAIFSEERIPEVRNAVMSTASEISKKLCYQMNDEPS